MTTCSDCKFWCAAGFHVEQGHDVIEKGGLYVTGVGEVRNVRSFPIHEEGEQELQHRRCLLALHANRHEFTSADEAKPMLLLDGSGYAASLYTLPTFSCSSFKERFVKCVHCGERGSMGGWQTKVCTDPKGHSFQ